MVVALHQYMILSTKMAESRDLSHDGLVKADIAQRNRFHYPNYKCLFEKDFSRHIGKSWAKFAKLDKPEKCRAFFLFMDSSYPDWTFDVLDTALFDKYAVNKPAYFRDACALIRKQKMKDKVEDPDEFSDKELQEIDSQFNARADMSLETEQKMADSMTMARLFGHCFYGDNPVQDDDMLHRYNKKLMPYFTHMMPSRQLETNVEPEREVPDVVAEFHNTLNGQGIVISATTRFTRDIVRLIHLLRALGNTLPIEIMYRRDLLTRSKQAISLAATVPKEQLLALPLSDERILKRLLSEFDISTHEFPVQSLTLVNMASTLDLLRGGHFVSYNNKLLALFCLSFAQALLLDADLVILQKPQYFFDMPEFANTGAYFFRDRSLADQNDWVETNFFSKLMPHQHLTLDMAMGIKPVTNHTMRNAYMLGWRHGQEAGVVVLDKKRHFGSLFPLLSLALWNEPVRSLIWGDKEMYWLAMSIAGNEDYTFNKFAAASVGVATESLSYKLYNNTKAREICLLHPGHVAADGTLLWINSGFSYCKKNSHGRDSHIFPYSEMDITNELADLYASPLKIRGAIVPPDLPALRPLGLPVLLDHEFEFLLHMKKRKKDVDQLDQLANIHQISEYGPQRGWIKTSCCSFYHYCAYDAITSYLGENEVQGNYFEFSSEEGRKFDFLGAIWLSGQRAALPQQPKSDSKASEMAQHKPTTGDAPIAGKVEPSVHNVEDGKISEKPAELPRNSEDQEKASVDESKAKNTETGAPAETPGQPGANDVSRKSDLADTKNLAEGPKTPPDTVTNGAAEQEPDNLRILNYEGDIIKMEGKPLPVQSSDGSENLISAKNFERTFKKALDKLFNA